MLPSSNKLEDWINPIHLGEPKNLLKQDPFEHFVVKQFFKEDIFEAIRNEALSLSEASFDIHPSGSYRFSAFPNENFFRFIYSKIFRSFLKLNFSLDLVYCKVFPCPLVYRFETKEIGLCVHTDYETEQPRDLGMIIYLHDKWEPNFGGELQFYEKTDLINPHTIIEPTPNTIVGFRVSPISYHSVRPSNINWHRMSIVVDWDILTPKK